MRKICRIKFSRQYGQASVELVICMIALLTVALGVICVGGLAISNVKVLTSARSNAEFSSHRDSAGGQGSEISSWDFGSDGVPFSADDLPGIADSSAINAHVFSDSSFSAAERPEASGMNYEFQPLPEVSYLYRNERNYTSSLSSAGFLAANLVLGNGGSRGVYTLDASEHGGTFKFNGTDAEVFKRLFINLTGRSFGDDLSSFPSNKVYFPVSGL